MSATPTAPTGAKKQRDLRLDFFRGLAMFIILVAHTPNSLWRMWIPARFGFSDATEIFVFCSGMASGIAFGAVFIKRGWHLGAARIAFRVWQVYWAHIGVVLATAGIMVLLQSTDMGEPGKDYTKWFPVGGFFSATEGRPEATLLGLFTLTYVPGLFDILPMYLVI
ncbi:MAG: OpgC domain-containing protein, partial [Paracoccaceae bacterium]